MATVRYVVNSALRKIGRLAAGREPRVADRTDVLAALQGLYLSWIAAGTFGRLKDVTPLANYVAGENQRIIRTDDTIIVTLPERIGSYGFRHYDQEVASTNVTDGSSRAPRDGAVIQIYDQEGGQTVTYLYDVTSRAWVDLQMLQLDDEAPRSNTDPEGLSATLALEIGDTFGAAIGPTTLAQSQRFITALCLRFDSPRQPVPGVYC